LVSSSLILFSSFPKAVLIESEFAKFNVVLVLSVVKSVNKRVPTFVFDSVKAPLA